MAELGLLTVTAADGQDLLAAAAAGWSRPVPDCPGWTAADLVGHMGAILGWMARIVTTGGAVPRPGRETPPADRGALAAWYTAQLDRTLSILAAAAPESPAWTFSSRGDHRVSWWRRRVAVEMAIHRWDAQHAAGSGPAAVADQRPAAQRAGDRRPAPGRGPVGSASPLTPMAAGNQWLRPTGPERTAARLRAGPGAPSLPAETVSARSQIAPVRSLSGPSR